MAKPFEDKMVKFLPVSDEEIKTKIDQLRKAKDEARKAEAEARKARRENLIRKKEAEREAERERWLRTKEGQKHRENLLSGKFNAIPIPRDDPNFSLVGFYKSL